jgi:hypothetical protein
VCPFDDAGQVPYLDLRVEGGGLEVGVAEQALDVADIGAAADEVRGAGVAQKVRRDTFRNSRGAGVPARPPLEHEHGETPAGRG